MKQKQLTETERFRLVLKAYGILARFEKPGDKERIIKMIFGKQ